MVPTKNNGRNTGYSAEYCQGDTVHEPGGWWHGQNKQSAVTPKRHQPAAVRCTTSQRPATVVGMASDCGMPCSALVAYCLANRQRVAPSIVPLTSGARSLRLTPQREASVATKASDQDGRAEGTPCPAEGGEDGRCFCFFRYFLELIRFAHAQPSPTLLLFVFCTTAILLSNSDWVPAPTGRGAVSQPTFSKNPNTAGAIVEATAEAIQIARETSTSQANDGFHPQR